MEEKNMKCTTRSSEYIIRRPWLTARKDVVVHPDGRVQPEYYVLEYPDFINVIAITTNGHIIMEQQWRQAVGGTWEQLLVTTPNSSTATNHCYTFVARGVEQTTTQHLDATEDLRYFYVSENELFTMLKEGKIHQAMMVAPLWKYFCKRSLTPRSLSKGRGGAKC